MSGAPYVPSVEAQAAGIGKVKPILTVGTTSRAGATAASAQSPALPPSVFYCSSVGYVFFRLHSILTQRLTSAKLLCVKASGRAPGASLDQEARAKLQSRTEGGSGMDIEECMDADEESASDLYEHFLTALSAVIEGTMESAKYEDECRQLMGSGSYQSFTMDKLVIQTVRQLQALVVDPVATKLRELYFYQLRRVEHLRATVPPAELPEALAALAASYRFECAGLAAARNEDCFCVEYIKASGSNKAVLAITLVDRPVTRPAADCLLAVDAPRLPSFVCRIVGRHCGSGDADGEAEEVLAPPSRTSGANLFRRNGLRSGVHSASAAAVPGSTGGAAGAGSGTASALATVAKPAAYQTRGTHWMTRTGRLVQAKGSTDVFVRAKGVVAGK